MAEKRLSFVTERDVEKARDNRTPANTTKHTSWSSNVYRKWTEARNKEFIDFTGENQQFKRVPNFEDLSIKEINYWNLIFDDVDDETLVNACVEYEKSVNSNLDLSGMLQAASVHGNVHININISK